LLKYLLKNNPGLGSGGRKYRRLCAEYNATPVKKAFAPVIATGGP